MAAPTICTPGQRICRLEEGQVAGSGTDVRQGYLYSCLAGYVNVREGDGESGKTVIEVLTEKKHNIVPSVGSLVTCRVTNVNPRFCKCAILGVDNMPLKESFRGLVRKEDVRATEKDRVEMYKSFRPGDLVIARVLSLGDAQSYLLTTAENELGVVAAVSEAGVNMVPVSWNEMICPKTMSKEFRKVAKVQPQYIDNTTAT
ncbi:exosome complex component CSL4 isoform X2 [Lingula anatina]|uniref:Exosome complex component CSL4 isoform X1 n=1 Tax=Lingula anatina TaxID=7574 RepID=A0A1S3H0D6_LINAN|nr:exosome complex component CSL4 isoform X1 [Lingula anatina]XP_013378634.1 exosome complex component CSL4 isoform X2 [Lingula anatina]|eukprot:XP_013378632.1 exosome complex component CSL4 isoform X1 [Lingula anatina]